MRFVVARALLRQRKGPSRAMAAGGGYGELPPSVCASRCARVIRRPSRRASSSTGLVCSSPFPPGAPRWRTMLIPNGSGRRAACWPPGHGRRSQAHARRGGRDDVSYHPGTRDERGRVSGTRPVSPVGQLVHVRTFVASRLHHSPSALRAMFTTTQWVWSCGSWLRLVRCRDPAGTIPCSRSRGCFPVVGS